MKKWKDKIISAFSILILFILALILIVIMSNIYDKNESTVIENTRFDNIKTEVIDTNIQAHTTSITVYKEDETENIWINVVTNRGEGKSPTNLIKIPNIAETDIEFTYDVFSDCIIITHTNTNSKYIYFKDSNTLVNYE